MAKKLTLPIDFFNHMHYSLIQNIRRKDKSHMSNKATKKTEQVTKFNVFNPATWNWSGFGRGIMGVAQLFVAASIIASAVIIYQGTEGIETRIIIAPMSAYAVYILVSKFISNKGKK